MAADNPTRQDEDFKKSLVSLRQNGKTPGPALQGLRRFPVRTRQTGRQYSAVETDDSGVPTAGQVKDLQKRRAQSEEETFVLKKRLPSSRRTQITVRLPPQTSFPAWRPYALPCSHCQQKHLTAGLSVKSPLRVFLKTGALKD